MRREVSKALVLNWLLGNGDAHLKNFGVLYQDDLDVRLAPFPGFAQLAATLIELCTSRMAAFRAN
jgi:serine/threonine protein kinase HipA of HipAB toxin-antitoxin module